MCGQYFRQGSLAPRCRQRHPHIVVNDPKYAGIPREVERFVGIRDKRQQIRLPVKFEKVVDRRL
jgi:hypothetical protein